MAYQHHVVWSASHRFSTPAINHTDVCPNIFFLGSIYFAISVSDKSTVGAILLLLAKSD